MLTQSNAATSCYTWQLLSTPAQGRENCSGQLFFENVLNKGLEQVLGTQPATKGGHAGEHSGSGTPEALPRENVRKPKTDDQPQASLVTPGFEKFATPSFLLRQAFCHSAIQEDLVTSVGNSCQANKQGIESQNH